MFAVPIPSLPIALPENLTLRFERLVRGEGVDEETGNFKLESQEFVAKAGVRQGDFKSQAKDLPGINVEAIYLEGYLINPKTLPADIGVKAQDRVKAEYLSPSGVQRGEFIVVNAIAHYSDAIVAVAGTPIKGFFSTIGGG